MIAAATARFGGSGLNARLLRSALFAIAGFGGSQFIRLAGNLVLTRLLFPEAFGLMALLAVIMQGLAMFSDVGISPSILHSKRGDDPDFLNTAWTIQAIRGVGLWLATCVLALPVAHFYNEPLLALMLPCAGFGLVVSGLNPTRMDTANRHLKLGRVTTLELTAQFIGIIIAIVLAWAMQSVWALVISGLATTTIQLLILNRFLPGQANRFRWEKAAAKELIHFGKWIFLSTIFGFIYLQGDKILLGKYLPFDQFGIYNIGYVLASVPLLMGGALARKVLIPVYRERPPKESRANYLQLRKMRFGLTAVMVGVLAVLSASGVVLVDFLYDPRYALAGSIVVMLAAMFIPKVIVLTYDLSSLAAGDSKRFALLSMARAVISLGLLFLGLHFGGLFGVMVAQGLSGLAIYPMVVWLARRTGAWDPLHDAVFAIIGVAVITTTFWLNSKAILDLASTALG